VRLVQPNAPQHEKFDPDKARIFVERSLRYTGAGARPDLVLWPETSVPGFTDQLTQVLQLAGSAGRGAPVIVGALRFENNTIYNSMVVLNPAGDITQTYDKHHIVPFGEYIPLRPLLAKMGLRYFADMFGQGMGRGKGAHTLDLGPLGLALPLICYEGVFAHDVNAAPMRADFMMLGTNDAWFGNFAGPKQHLAQAQMRAIEQGLPMIRAANTGISAVIDPLGRITDSLALNEAGYIDALLPAPNSATFYSRMGDMPIIGILVLVAFLTLLAKNMQRRDSL